jgi:transporter family protein
MWIIFALLAAVSAALVAIFGKLGLKTIDSTLGTTIRSIVMALFLILTSLVLGKWKHFTWTSLSSKDWWLIVFAGIAGALSWLFYFFALKNGDATKVAALDRLSIVFVIILAAIFLSEGLTWKSLLGATCMAIGAILISLK